MTLARTAAQNEDPSVSPAPGRADLPLGGVRVVDLTMVWAGPFATKHLADLGAEVIKIEGPARLDHVRTVSVPNWDAAEPYNESRYFNEYNRNKLGMAIDLRTAEGQELVRSLVAKSDVLIENFRPGVVDRMGLGYEQLKKVNPRLVFVSLPGYSSSAEEGSLPGYGPNIEQMGGLAHLNGYRDGPPMKSGISYGDPVAGLGGVAAVLLALVHRERTGRGQYIEAGQRNILIGMVGDAIVAHQLGQEPLRIGNRSRLIAPQGVYPSQGEDGTPAGEADSWLAISVVTDAQWTRLCDVIGRPDIVTADHYADVLARRAAHDEIDEIISGWTAGHTARQAADALQRAGVPASPVLTADQLRDDPQLTARDFLRSVPHRTLGQVTVTSPTWRFRGVEPVVTAAPALGEHNAEVLREILHISDERIDELTAAGVIGSSPVTGLPT